MLHLIVGESGSGKTFYARKSAVGLSENEKSDVMLLVPEQYSFDTERALIKSGKRLIDSRLEVMSFTSVARRVFEEYGENAAPLLPKGLKSVAMALAVKECAPQSRYLSRFKAPARAAAVFSALYSELKQNGTKPQELEKAAISLNEGTLKDKALSLSRAFGVYEGITSEGFSSDERMLEGLINHSGTAGFFNGKTVICDGFKGFTGEQQRVLELMIRHCSDVYITLCADNLDRVTLDTPVFSQVKKTASRLIAFAASAGIGVAAPVYLRENMRAGFGIQTACRLLAGKSSADEALHEADEKGYGGAVILKRCTDKYCEADFAAATVKKLLYYDKTLRCRDIAVIARSADDYALQVAGCFSKYGIPCHIDRRRPLYKEPVAVFIQNALSAVNSSFSPEEIFAALKTGMTDITAEQTARLERYFYIWGLKGDSFFKELTLSPYGASGGQSEKSDAELKELNVIRERIAAPFKSLKEDLAGCGDGSAAVRAVYRFLQCFSAEEATAALYRSALSDGRHEDAESAVKAYNTVISLLSGMDGLLKNRTVSAGELADLFSAAVMHSDMGQLPQGLDEVRVGSADRMRPAEPKIVFILGANDGVFPGVPSSSGVLSDRERRVLSAAGLSISDRCEDELCEEQFLFYSSVGAASKRVYITCSTGSSAAAPSESAEFLMLEGVFGGAGDVPTQERAEIDAAAYESGIVKAADGSHQTENTSGASNSTADGTCGGIAVNTCGGADYENGANAKSIEDTALSALDTYYSRSFTGSAAAEDAAGVLAVKNDERLSYEAANMAARLLFENRTVGERLSDAVLSAAENRPEKLSAEASAKLFGRDMKLSPTGVESFFKCRFRYFCQYGMRVRAVRPVDFDAMLRGTLVHYVLEQLFLPENREKLEKTDEQSLKSTVHSLAKGYTEKYLGGINNKPACFKYALKRIEEDVCEVSGRLARELFSGSFRVLGCEQQIASGGDITPRVLKTDRFSLRVEGVADRIDICEYGGKHYIRVLDYKTGRKKLDFDELKYGLGLQMLIYLFSVEQSQRERLGGEIVPSGVFYVPASNRAVRSDTELDEEAAGEKSDKLARFNGVVLDDEKNIELLGAGKNAFLPIEYKSDGTLSKKSSVAAEGFFRSIREQTDKLLLNMGELLSSGDIACDVLDPKGSSGCDYCDYSPVCRLSGQGAHRAVKPEKKPKKASPLDASGESTVNKTKQQSEAEGE